MAKEVIWTERALLDRFKIYTFWAEHNSSITYSKKLEQLFIEYAKLIAEFPEVGVRTNVEDIRFKVVRHFKMFYKEETSQIIILRVWDVRQDPERLKF